MHSAPLGLNNELFRHALNMSIKLILECPLSDLSEQRVCLSEAGWLYIEANEVGENDDQQRKISHAENRPWLSMSSYARRKIVKGKSFHQ